MRYENIQTLTTCTVETLPTLDVAVLAALELLADVPVPKLDISTFKKPIVIGSANAGVVGRLLFAEQVNVVFASESSYEQELERHGDIDAAVIISASGGKHAVQIAKTLKEHGVPVQLITNNADALAGAYVAEEQRLLFPKNREPYTYNTSTYMGMLLSKSDEDIVQIYEHITNKISPLIEDFPFKDFSAMFFIIPHECVQQRSMFITKFDELFGPHLLGRVFTFEESKHAKTVVSSSSELFVSFGDEQNVFGAPEQRMHIPLPPTTGPVATMAIVYYVIGHIQKANPPYFAENITDYTKQASQLFNQAITPIVE